MSSEHHATFGCLIEDEEGNVYLVTNKHVTLASEGEFFTDVGGGNKCYIGSSRYPNKRNLEICASADWDIDIDTIYLENGILDRCFTDVFDTNGKRRKCKIYDGSLDSIYGKKVFKCRPFWENYKNKRIRYETPQSGNIASFRTHAELKSNINVQANFVVECDKGTFSQPGESGAVIALESSDKTVELVGIICGDFKTKGEEKSKLSKKNYTICVFLKQGLIYLGKKHSQVLKLHYENEQQREYKIDNLQMIQYGTLIFFKTPEYIEPLSFDLCQHISVLLCTDANIPVETKHLAHVMVLENELRAAILDRQYFETWIFDIDRGDQYTLHNCYKACQFLYGSQTKKAEKHLKMASRSLVHERDLFSRFLCKLVSYTTWCFLQLNQPDQTKKILDEGLDYILENKHDTSIPKESLPYQYYDYSRYYMCLVKPDRENAEEKAKQSVNLFKKHYEEDRSEDSANRVIMSSCQLVGVKLGCGELFNLIDAFIPTSKDINGAEDILKSIEPMIITAPVVRKVEYPLNLTDLEFRKRYFPKALKYAKHYLRIATLHNMDEDKTWAETRIKTILNLP